MKDIIVRIPQDNSNNDLFKRQTQIMKSMMSNFNSKISALEKTLKKKKDKIVVNVKAPKNNDISNVTKITNNVLGNQKQIVNALIKNTDRKLGILEKMIKSNEPKEANKVIIKETNSKQVAELQKQTNILMEAFMKRPSIVVNKPSIIPSPS